MSHTIELRGLRASGICGALPEERERRQPLEVDISIDLDLSLATQSDDLSETVDYGAVCAVVEGVLIGERFVLLERLAERLIEVISPLCLPVDDQAVISVSVRKLRPPVPQALDTSGVRIVRELSK